MPKRHNDQYTKPVARLKVLAIGEPFISRNDKKVLRDWGILTEVLVGKNEEPVYVLQNKYGWTRFARTTDGKIATFTDKSHSSKLWIATIAGIDRVVWVRADTIRDQEWALASCQPGSANYERITNSLKFLTTIY